MGTTATDYVPYKSWSGMMGRSFSLSVKKRKPYYEDSTCCKEWLKLSSYAMWYENYMKGFVNRKWQLDKDIILAGNEVYGPEGCCLVPNYVNVILADSAATRGDNPIGVGFLRNRSETTKCYISQIRLRGKNTYLGSFFTPEEAHKEWQIAKQEAILDVISRYEKEPVVDKRVVDGLFERISKLKEDVSKSKITQKL